MCDCIKKSWEQHKGIYLSILFILFTFFIGTLIVTQDDKFILYFHLDEKDNIDLNQFLAFCSGLATAALAIIAYYKIQGVIKSNQTQILLEIDKRWGERGILKARYIIHNIYRECMNSCFETNRKLNDKYPKYLDTNFTKCAIREHKLGIVNEDRDIIMNKLSLRIMRISVSSNERDQKNFIYLLELLEFMDFIGYLVEANQVTAEEIQAVFGNSIVFNYEVFEHYIKVKEKHGKTKNQDMEYYPHFKHLFKELKKLNNKSKAAAKR